MAAGENLTLLGGTVVNTGTLHAPGGQITVAAIPGSQRVRLNHANMVLGLEIAPWQGATALPTAQSLPQLLTGGAVSAATGLSVDPDGTVRLSSGEAIASNPGTTMIAGTVDASLVGATGGQVLATGDRVELREANIDVYGTGGTATLTATNDLTITESQIRTGGDLTLLAETVQIQDTAATPIGLQAGDSLTIEGTDAVEIFALNHPGSGFYANADMVLRSSQRVQGDANFWSGGNFRIEQLNGDLGGLV
ncbi:MAG: hypothetical protein HC881_22555 [Leptolyngbyaceae cyanobacterium SL_7_1]|nr:hypothetical protein [Leptolyngbyaceae cyanobacterium SL_7_1]